MHDLNFSYQLIEVPYLVPARLERERSRDGTCHNLSAVERNRQRILETSKYWIDDAHRRIYAPRHVIAQIEKAFHA